MGIKRKIQKDIRQRKIEVVFTNERLITPSGLSIVGGLLRKSELVRLANRMPVKQKLRDDLDFFKDALGIKRGIPAAETLRQRMDDIGSSLRGNLLQANVSMFQNHQVIPSEIPQGLVPVDLNVTPFDNSKTKKEGVSRTYKGYDGYAPMIAYIGAEGFMANCELREGKQHCQKNTPKDAEVRLIGFGTFKKAKRAARKGRNPQTGAEIEIAASESLSFKSGVKY